MSGGLNSRIRSGVIWSLVQNWGVRLGGLLVFMLLARILSPGQMGLFAAATTVIAFCALFVDSGLSEAIVQTPEVTPRQLGSVFVVNLVLAVAVVIGIWFSAPLLADYFDLPELVAILRISVFTVLLNALSFSQTAMFRRTFMYKRLALFTLAATVISGVVAVGLALTGFGVWSLVAQALLVAATTAALLWLNPAWSFSWQFDYSSIEGLLSYGVKRLLTALMDFANTRFIELFFASLFGAATLGLYVVGARVYQILMQVLCSSILDIAHNAFSRLAANTQELREAYYSALGLASATSMPVFFLLSMVATELVIGMFGQQWSQAGGVMVPLLLLGGIQVLQFFNGILYNALGRPGIGLVFMVGKTVITMGTLYLVRHLSFEEVVWAYFGSQIVTAPISFYVAKRVVGISFRRVARQVWPFLAATGIAMASMHAVRAPAATGIALVDMALLLAVGGGVFAMTAFMLARERVMDIVRMLRQRRVEPI